MSLEAFQEKLKTWNFPLCQLGEDHADVQLNKLCVDSRCKRSDVLSALCVVCEEDDVHHQQGHVTKPLKLILKSLLNACVDQPSAQRQEDPLEAGLTRVARDFRALAHACLRLQHDVQHSLEIYKRVRDQESPQRAKCRVVLERLLDHAGDTKTLRECLNDLRTVTAVENEMIKINEDTTQSLKRSVRNNTEKYLQVMNESLKRLDAHAKQLAEISVMQGIEDGDDFVPVQANLQMSPGSDKL